MTTVTTVAPVVLEPAAQEFADATANPPYLYDLGAAEGRKTVDQIQSGEIDKPDAEIEDTTIPGGPSGDVSIRIVRPKCANPSGRGGGVALPASPAGRPRVHVVEHAVGERLPASPAGRPHGHVIGRGMPTRLPVILYTHGAGWVFGNADTHDRLIRELAVGTGAAVVFTNYSLSPEARYPTAIEEIYAALSWVAEHGYENNLDGSRIVVAGDSVGGNMSAAITLMVKQRSGPKLSAQVLFYPVTDASFDTDSYHHFAEGYFLSRDAMEWFWDQYTTDENQRNEITASPLRATSDDLAGLPKALVITGEADVLRDEGEAYGRKLRKAGVDVTATRYEGIVHDFVMLNALRSTNAADAAIAQAITYIRKALA